METTRLKDWKAGVADGIPICLGYIAVSFTFGIMAKRVGVTSFQAVIISLTNLTSAGQFAALNLISTSAAYLEMAFTQFIINLRYCLMSCSLSQKFSSKTLFYHRFLVAFGITDEIFGVSVCREGRLKPFYNYGLMSIAILGWTFGTLLGVISGSILPERILSALGVALYGMFIAIIVPAAREHKLLLKIIIISMAVSLIFEVIPILNQISSGFKIIILTVGIAGIAAYFFPVEGVEESER